MTPETIAHALGRSSRKSNGGYMAQCPCHPDEKASLSIDTGGKGLIVKCFAGCKGTDIISALKGRGLWPEAAPKEKRTVVTRYNYGPHWKTRFSDKSFSFSYQKDGRWIHTRNGSPIPYRLNDIQAADSFCIVEGEKDADNLGALDMPATTLDAGADSPVPPELITAATGKDIVLIPDNDPPGRKYVDRIGAALLPVAKSAKLLLLPGLKSKQDVSDWLAIPGNDKERLLELIKQAPEWTIAEALQENSRIKVVDVLDFMALEFPPRENILSPWLPCQGLAMVYAPRGIGKTHFSLGLAYAAASGGSFLGWQAPSASSVLFIDGEMPGRALQERIAHIATSSDKEPGAAFRIITPDMQPSGMIDLTRLEDQEELQPYLDGISLVIVDNLSTLCRTGKESEGEGWLPVQQWALQQRAAGRSVLFIHHAGKSGEQRGTSRREDVLDTVIALKRPGDYTPDMGACFEVHFEKARGLYGDETKPFEARLMTAPDGLQSWAMKPLEDSTAEKVAKLLNEGIPQHEIPDLLKLSKGAVSKAKHKAASMGLLKGVS